MPAVFDHEAGKPNWMAEAQWKLQGEVTGLDVEAKTAKVKE